MNSLNRFYPLALLFYFSSIVFICYFSIQKQFISILLPAGIAFAAFFLLLNIITKRDKIMEVLILIILVKITILFSFPHLSDDIYRFWWDGFLSCNGVSPYQFSPTEIINQFQAEPFYPSLLKNYPLLNSANYHTAYPLVCQWIFRLSASLSGDNLYVFNLILKFIFLLADCLILFFFFRLSSTLKFPFTNAVLFYGNPLCILELNGNLHFEMIMILFLIISIYLFEIKAHLFSGMMLGWSVVSKLVSFIWTPLFIKWPFWKKSNLIFVLGLIIPLGFFLSLLWPSILDYQNGLGMYFQKFEFNSFIYRPLWEYFYDHKWYESQSKISLVLMILFVLIYLLIIIKDWITRQEGFSFKSAWLILFAYLLLGTTIHPWYLTPLIFMSVFSFQYTSLAWSFLILLSYARYDLIYKPYEPYLVFIEYFIVIGFFFYELRKTKIEISEM